MEFRKIFQGGRIGAMELKNRVVLAPMVRNWADEAGMVTQRMIEHYAAIAAGGMGMLLLEACFIEPIGRGFLNQLGIHNDECIKGLQSLADVVHQHGAKLGAQIFHAGRQTVPQFCGGQPVAPSAKPCGVMQFIDPDYSPRELTTEEVGLLADAFAEAARRNQEAGLDFLELHGAHGYLINQFLSPYTNQRSDKYGRDFAGRMEFPLEVLQKVRDKVGPDYPVTIRLNGNDFIEGGVDLPYAQKVVKELDRAGIDAFHITGEIYESFPQGKMISPMSIPAAPLVDLAAAIKQVTAKPVIAVAKLYRPELMEDILAKGQADFVALGRSFLADPQFLIKVQEGRRDEINFCTTCQGCQERLFAQQDVQCAVNPWCGREKELAIEPAARKKKVMVAGGGPAGMQAAWVAAQRGHQVTLYEKDNQLGGQALLAATPPFREDWKVFIRYQAKQVKQSGVQVITGATVTPELVTQEQPDALIMAIGSGPVTLDLPGADNPNVVQARDVLRGSSKVRSPVIVVGGGLVGCGVAEFLAAKGHQVSIVEMLGDVAADMFFNEKTTMMERWGALAIDIHTETKVTAITPTGVTVEKEGQSQEIAGESVIMALGSKPDQTLAGLKDKVPGFFSVGDCQSPRKIMDAVYEGAKAGCQV